MAAVAAVRGIVDELETSIQVGVNLKIYRYEFTLVCREIDQTPAFLIIVDRDVANKMASVSGVAQNAE